MDESLMPECGASAKLHQALFDRCKRGARCFTAAEIDDKQDDGDPSALNAQ
jgi:hypothetical protein